MGAQISEAELRRLELIGKISEFFSKADADNDAKVTLEEFQTIMADRSMADCIKQLKIPVAMTATELFSYLDADGNGAITANELVDGCSRWTADSQRLVQKIISKR